MATHLEFFGLQGAGKSRIYQELLNLTRNQKSIVSFDNALYSALKNGKINQKDISVLLKLVPYSLVKPILLNLIYPFSRKRMDSLEDFQASNSLFYSYILKK